MNFTYLVEGPTEPPQDILEKYTHYVVIVVLSEDMSGFVLENLGFELKGDANALCWLIQPKHLKTAPKGSALNRLHEFIRKQNMYSDIEHSFLASVSHKELLEKSGGSYIPLYLHSEDDDERRKIVIQNAVNNALANARPKSSLVNIDRVLSAGRFVAALIGLR